MTSSLKKTKILLELLTDIILAMLKKSTRGEIHYVIYRYFKAYNKYMKKYDNQKIIVISQVLGCE